jgi:hypothetical protein
MWEFDIICEIINETELDAYNIQVDILKNAINEGRALTNLPQLHNKDSKAEKPPTANTDINKLKYRPLPAITPPPLNPQLFKAGSDYVDIHGNESFMQCNLFY